MERENRPTYSDQYVPALVDEEAEAYFRTLPGHIQNQIDALKRRPSNLAEMKKAAERAGKIY